MAAGGLVARNACPGSSPFSIPFQTPCSPQSLPPRDFPKLPLALFEDVAPGGGLSVIAARLAAIRRSTPNFKGFEWSNPGQRRFNLEALAYVRADLLRAGLLKVPVVAVDATCGAEKDRVAEAAKKLGATVVENPGVQGRLGQQGRYAPVGEEKPTRLAVRWAPHHPLPSHSNSCCPDGAAPRSGPVCDARAVPKRRPVHFRGRPRQPNAHAADQVWTLKLGGNND
jgi:hypothetical protein